MCFFKKRETIEIEVCSATGQLPNAFCPEKMKRRYYKNPRPGEPRWMDLVPCTFHVEPDPRPTYKFNVCKLTGLIPGAYCPEIEARDFYLYPDPGDPLPPETGCQTHRPPQADHSSPRTGIDIYQLIVFPLEQIRTYLDDLVRNGGSLGRCFGDFTWPEDLDTAGWIFSLYKQVGWWTETSGDFAGRRFPLFTIDRSDEYGDPWNEPIWEKWAAVFKMCQERGIEITWSIFDGCSMKTALARRYNPLLQNVQHHGADGPAEYTRLDGSTGRGYGIHTGGIYGGFGSEAGAAMKEYLPALIKKVVDTLRASGADFRINPGNEMERGREGTETQAEVDQIIYDYHAFWIEQLQDLGIPASKIVLSLTGTNTRDRTSIPLKAKYDGLVEQIHGPNSDETLLEFIDLYPEAEIDGDGFDQKAEGFLDEFNFQMPSLEQCRRMRQILAACGMRYQTFNGYIEGIAWQDLTLAGWTEQRALAGRE